VLDDHVLRRKLGMKSAERAANLFSEEAAVRELVEVYSQLSRERP
jgi:glycosyltransferase involved in cell wall biosynthesis